MLKLMCTPRSITLKREGGENGEERIRDINYKQLYLNNSLFWFWFCLAVLGFELRTLNLLGRTLSLEPHL
jgi:hypothetical protein